MSPSAILEVNKLTKRFGGLIAVSDVDFTIEEGQIVGLIGPNGAGKSTLFNTISGFYCADSGSVIFSGTDITARKAYDIVHYGIARTFQIPRPFLELSVIDNVVASVLYGRAGAGTPARALEKAVPTLEFTGLLPWKDNLARKLPLMGRKRLELARALATEPRLLLLDEVFAGLTEAETQDAVALINRIRTELGITVFMIEHVMKTVMAVCERIVVMHHGAKIAEGRPAEIAANQVVIDAYLGQSHA